MNEHETSSLIVVGHSLGAATAAILTDMLIDHLKEFQEKIEGFNLKCFGYAPACGLSLELAEKHKVNIHPISPLEILTLFDNF